jgi:hypothetical protein
MVTIGKVLGGDPLALPGGMQPLHTCMHITKDTLA